MYDKHLFVEWHRMAECKVRQKLIIMINKSWHLSMWVCRMLKLVQKQFRWGVRKNFNFLNTAPATNQPTNDRRKNMRAKRENTLQIIIILQKLYALYLILRNESIWFWDLVNAFVMDIFSLEQELRWEHWKWNLNRQKDRQTS